LPPEARIFATLSKTLVLWGKMGVLSTYFNLRSIAFYGIEALLFICGTNKN